MGSRPETGNRPSTGNQPQVGTRPQTGNTPETGNRNPGSSPGAAGAGFANRNQPGTSNAGAAAAGAGLANRNQPGTSNAGAAAAGAGLANRNQPGVSNAGAAAAGAGLANRNQPGMSNAGAAAAGAGYANRNQPGMSNAGAAAAGASYANRNQPGMSNAGAAALGAGYANRNQPGMSNAGAAALGAGYANRNQYNQYHPGMTNGYWNGNNGALAAGVAMGGIAAWGAGSPMYGYGYSGYTNPYASGMNGVVVVQPGVQAQPSGGSAYNYAQPINSAAAAPEPTAIDQATAAFDQARDAFKANDYATAAQLNQKALAQMPNDTTLHEFLALVLFAQGKYEPAAAPLYAVLSIGPGWDWTTLISNYADAGIYTDQVRKLEAYVKANPKSAQPRFVLAYHYITQGHGDAAATELKQVVALEPNDSLSAQLLAKLEPAATESMTPPPAQPFDAGKLTGNWVAQAPQNSKVTLTIKDDGGFTWNVALAGKPPTAITGTSTVADGVLTLNAGPNSQVGALTGDVVWQDDTHFTFRATGAPANDPGLKFTR